MSDTERLAAIAARHQPVPIEMSNRDPKPVWCATCGSGGLPWPCDTRIVLDALARAEGTPGLDAVAFARALRRHEPSIDYHYEEFTCACGWDSDKHRRDSYMAHVQSQVLAVLATLDAARAETPGLDLERLARALRNMSGYLADPLDAGDYAGLLSVSDFAADIAREYAALAGADHE